MSSSSRTIVRECSLTLNLSIICDDGPLPPTAPTTSEDDELFSDDPWIIAPIRADYGLNIKLGAGAFVNFNACFVDTCLIEIGARTLCGPNCCFYSGTHPLDPALRRGTAGPELGKPIKIGEDCWLGTFVNSFRNSAHQANLTSLETI